MVELDDFELQKTAEESTGGPAPAGRSRAPLVAAIVAAAIAAAAIAAYLWLPRAEPAPPATQKPTIAFRPVDGAAPPARRPTDIPPLDQSDPVVRRLVAALSSHPRVMAWLATSGLIRNFTVVVENIAAGASPARHLRMLRPAGGFTVIEQPQGFRLDPRSYERYNGIADAVGSVDAAGAAMLYATLDARLEEAYQELGHQDGFDTALQRAMSALLAVPVVTGPVPLVFKGALNGYADARLERLTPAQKQLLRMGPRNVTIIQGKLREIAAALGMTVG
jgi:hypothetical protein